MSSYEKLLNRLLTKPTDFKWKEAVTLLSRLGFTLLKGSGSGRKFVHKDTKQLIIIHEPHPGDILKAYAVKKIIEALKEGGMMGE